MTTAVMNYVFAPLSGFWSSISRTCEVVGYSRAAAQLTALGYHEEAKEVYVRDSELENTGEK